MRASTALALACAAAGAASCGFTTHTTLAHRAVNHFWSPGEFSGYALLVQNAPSFLYAGAPYPDYLYQCGSNHDGERARVRACVCV